MKRNIEFSKKAEKQFHKLTTSTQKTIKQKMEYFASMENPLSYAKPLTNFEFGNYRFRIGDYRIICDVDEAGNLIIIALIGHRREIYE